MRHPKNWQFIVVKKLRVSGMTLFPFVLIKNKNLLRNQILVNHEHIHLRQQLELGILPFYLMYVVNYLINLWKYKIHDIAYRNICFEREAYKFENDLNYLQTRRWYAWKKFL